MKQAINFYQFANEFERIRPNQFSHEALSLLWDYFEEFEENTRAEIELDVIAICCQFTERHFLDIANDYSFDLSECEDSEERLNTVTDYLRYYTTVVGVLDDRETIIYDQEF